MEENLLFVKSLKLGDTVYLYELKETKDGSFNIICTQGVLDFVSKYADNSGRIRIDGNSGGFYRMHIKGPANVPMSNKLWTTKRNDKAVYELFLNYAREKKDQYQKMADKQAAKEKAILELMNGEE
jgi:hypothetical protein